MPFGNENAESDKLLYDCFVTHHSATTSKPILYGRWGTGKSAIILYSNKALSEVLRAQSKPERLWYLTEHSLDLIKLQELKSKIKSKSHLIRAFERVWKAEISRTMCLLLAALHKYYGSPRGTHWDFISRTSSLEQAKESIWRRVGPGILKIITGENERVDAAVDLQSALEDIFSERCLPNIQKCLADIKSYAIQPLVAIEPIESPVSDIEQSGLAQMLITALLNVFRSDFEPAPHQLMQIKISVPWHRFVPGALDFPQKLVQYKGNLKWGEESLKNFINNRITWEFERVGRQFSPKGGQDAWSMLFEKSVTNPTCRQGLNRTKVEEGSFRYFLRHTHYRPRDILHLASRAVEKQAEASNMEIDDIILGRGGNKVSSAILRETTETVCSEAWEIFLSEIKRKYDTKVMEKIITSLYGLKVPFTADALKRRLQGRGLDLLEAIDKLWESGIIGFELIPKDQEIPLTGITKENLRHYKINGSTVSRYYFFEHNTENKKPSAMLTYGVPEADLRMILHPKSFEHFMVSINSPCPLGV